MRVINETKKTTKGDGKVKSIKIQPKFREYRRFRFGPCERQVVPEIRLSGFWLAELGFFEGMRVLVVVGEGRITLELVNEREEGESVSMA